MKPGTALSRKIIRELQDRGWWATQVSAAMNTGVPDILATRPGGSIFIEVKALGDTIRDSQLNWAILYHKQCRGHVYIVEHLAQNEFMLCRSTETHFEPIGTYSLSTDKSVYLIVNDILLDDVIEEQK